MDSVSEDQAAIKEGSIRPQHKTTYIYYLQSTSLREVDNYSNFTPFFRYLLGPGSIFE